MGTGSVSAFLKKYTMVIALVVVFIFFSITTSGKILLPPNINNLISQNGYVFVLGTGMLLCILTGGNIDLSVGSVVCFTGGIGAIMMQRGLPWILAVIVMLAVGLLVGMFQGFWIAWVSVPPFIATLAGMYAFRGLSNVVMGGYSVGINDETFLRVFGGGADCYIPDFIGGRAASAASSVAAGAESVATATESAVTSAAAAVETTAQTAASSSLNLTCLVAGIVIIAVFVLMSIKGIVSRQKKGISSGNAAGEFIKVLIISALVLAITIKLAQYKGIPTVLIWIALILLIYGYVTSNTAIGRYFYAVGGNEKATRLSGVNTKLVYFIAYANMGLLAGFAGILAVARGGHAEPTYGMGYEMDAIASCFIGGASAYGGVGKITGVIIGASLMGVINQGMSIMGISANYQSAVKGAVLLIAVLVDVLSKKEKA